MPLSPSVDLVKTGAEKLAAPVATYALNKLAVATNTHTALAETKASVPTNTEASPQGEGWLSKTTNFLKENPKMAGGLGLATIAALGYGWWQGKKMIASATESVSNAKKKVKEAYKKHIKKDASDEEEDEDEEEEKKPKSKKKKESSESSEGSSWRKWLIGGISTVGASALAYTYREEIGKFFEKEKKLSMQDAIALVQGNMQANASESHLQKQANITWKEPKLTVAGHEFTIVGMTIEGLGITFKNYEELVTTAIMIGLAQKEFAGRCPSATPFSISPKGGDIEILDKDGKSTDVASGSGRQVGKRVGGVTGATLAGLAGVCGLKNAKAGAVLAAGGAVGGAAAGSAALDHNDTLSQVCPALNEDVNKKSLVAYLNRMGCWESKSLSKDELKKKAETTNESVNQQFTDTLVAIQSTSNDKDPTNRSLEGERQSGIKNYNGKPDVFVLHARGHPVYMKADLDGDTVKSVTIEDLGITFDSIDKALRVGLLINRCVKSCGGKSSVSNAFSYRDSPHALQNGLMFDEEGMLSLDDNVLKQTTMNTYFGNKQTDIDLFVSWLNKQKSGGQSIRTNKKGGERTVSEYLNQYNAPVA